MSAPARPDTLSNRGTLEPFIKDEVKFYEHQVECVRGWWKKRSFILADDMGLGKSLQALSIYGMRLWVQNKKGMPLGDMLVVCPVSLKYNWLDEIDRFTGYHGMVLEGAPAKRRKQLEMFASLPAPKVLIVNYEQVIAHLKELNDLEFDMVAADEAHYLKNHKSKRTKAYRGLKAKSHLMLTGTPLLNNPSELWVMLDRVAPGKWGTYYQFIRRYCAFGGYEGKQILGVKNEAELRQKMAPYMLRRLKKDVLDLPEVQIIRRELRLLPEQKKVYNEIIEMMRIQDADENSAMGANIDNPLTKYLRLKQVCGTLATVLGPDKDVSCKLDAAIEDMETFISNGEKVVVFTQFRGVLDAYSKRLEKNFPKVTLFYLHGGIDKDDRQNIAKAWASVDGPAIILGTFPVMSVGLNLTAAKVMQFLDKDYVPAINQQAIDRCNRIGASTTQPIQVFEYIAAKTAEERIEKLLEQKIAINDAVIEKKTAPTFGADMMKLLEEKAE